MKAYVFPGQGAQFSGMGKKAYENSEIAKELFEKANEILGFKITDIMFDGSDEDLRQTKVTQPAIFLHSVILAKTLGDDFKPDMVAGHSLGEFSALVAAGALSFEDGLKLVYKRAMAMQDACEKEPSTMAAILGLEDEYVADFCKDIDDVVVPANFNSPGQIVISGTVKGIDLACEILTTKPSGKINGNMFVKNIKNEGGLVEGAIGQYKDIFTPEVKELENIEDDVEDVEIGEK